MDIGKIFFLLKENDKITRQELYGCGADDNYIQSAIDNDILVFIGNDEFKVGNPEELVYYGRYLMELKDFKAANSVFNCAYVSDFNNFVVNYQLFYRSLGQKKRGRVFKHFEVVRDNFINEGRECDANYYLFLLGNLFELDDSLRDEFNDLELEDILIPSDDEFSNYENELRKNVFSNSYHNVTTMVDSRFAYDDRTQIPFEDMVEKELLLQWLVRKRNFNKDLATCLDNNNMESAKHLLDNEDERRGLTTTNEYILKIVNSYFTVRETGIIPISKYEGDNVFDAINGNNYELALKLEEKRLADHNIERESILHKALKKIVSLINSKENGVVEEKEIVDEPVVETPTVISPRKSLLDESERQAIDSKIEKLHSGRMLFLLDPMPQEKRDLVRDYLNSKGYDDISAFSIGEEPDRRIVLRYKPRIIEHINIKEVLDDAKAFYASEDYELAAECYEIALKIGRPRDTSYGGYGMTLFRLKRMKEAIDCLKVATILSKTEGTGKIDYTDFIERLECPPDRENRKPRVVVKESEFDDNKESGLDETIINDLIGLYSEGEISLIDACKQLNLSEEDTNYVKLLYARDCYYLGNDKDGDKYFKQVEKSKAKDKRVKELYKEIQINKKYYRNRYDESKNQVVFIKK